MGGLYWGATVIVVVVVVAASVGCGIDIRYLYVLRTHNLKTGTRIII